MLDCLARDGYVARRHSETDRRAVLVALTPAGATPFEAAHEHVEALRARRVFEASTRRSASRPRVLLRRLSARHGGAGVRAGGARGGRSVRRHYGVTLAVLAVAGLSFALLQTMVAPALPAIQREFGASTTAVTWVLTVYLLTASIFTPILGRLGDMFGKERCS